MADFVRFVTETGAPILINADAVCIVSPLYTGVDTNKNRVYSEELTAISFIGSEDDLAVVKEPFESVAAKLNKLF